MTEDVANAAQPIYALLCAEAAKGKIVQNDDTKARIIQLLKKISKNKRPKKRMKEQGFLRQLFCPH